MIYSFVIAIEQLIIYLHTLAFHFDYNISNNIFLKPSGFRLFLEVLSFSWYHSLLMLLIDNTTLTRDTRAIK